MAMENTLFIGYFPIETPISSGFPIATDCWFLASEYAHFAGGISRYLKILAMQKK